MRKREKMKMRTKILIMIRDHGSCVVMLCRRFLALGELDQWQVLDCTITHVFLPVLRQSNGCFSFRLCSTSTSNHTIEALCLNFPMDVQVRQMIRSVYNSRFTSPCRVLIA